MRQRNEKGPRYKHSMRQSEAKEKSWGGYFY